MDTGFSHLMIHFEDSFLAGSPESGAFCTLFTRVCSGHRERGCAPCTEDGVTVQRSPQSAFASRDHSDATPFRFDRRSLAVWEKL